MTRRRKALGMKTVTVLLAVFLLVLVFPFLLTENARAHDEDLLIWGMIFDSDGSLLSYDTNFRVWVLHNSTWKGFPSNDTWDIVGTQGGHYTYNLTWEEKEQYWSDGDPYRIQIDCTPSSGLAENATSNGTGSAGDPVSPRGSYNNELNWLTGGGMNNTQVWDVVCSNVDLVPTGVEIDGIPYTPPMGVSPFSTVDISAMVTNNGMTNISEPNTIVLRNQSGLIGQDTAVTIGPGNSTGPYSFLWNAPDGGYFCFNITVDYYDNVTETNEVNNNEMICLSVGAADLTPSDIEITTDYGTQFYADASATSYMSNVIPITPGTNANIISNVSNVGGLTSEVCSIDFYNTSTEGGPIVGMPFFESGVPSIGAGLHSGPFAGSWQAQPVYGNYYVNITADYYDDVLEINPLNNTFILRFLVGYPDYIPWNDTLLLVQNVTSGSAVPIEVIVRNVGLLDALSDSTLAFYDEGAPLPFASYHVLPIGAGQNSTQAYSVNWPSPIVTSLTSYNVSIVADDEGNITEMNEFNNTLTIQFWVHPGPVTTLNVRDPKHINATGKLYIKSTTLLNFTVEHTTEWAQTFYYLDDVGPLDYSMTGEFNFSQSSITDEGLHYVNFSSIDSMGNQEDPWNSQEVIIDDSPPRTTMGIGIPWYDLLGTLWVTSNTPLELTWTKDDEPELAVGREQTRYRIFQFGVNWTSWSDYALGTPLDLGNEDGPRYVEGYSADFLGNEIATNWTLQVDNTPPEITFLIDGKPSSEIEGTPYVKDTTLFSLSANDRGCGVNGTITYNWEGGELNDYTSPFTFDKPGEHTIYVTSRDYLDNTNTTSFEVFVLGPNYKPIIAIICIIVMILVGALIGYKRPLLMTRKKMREAEDKLLKEEETEEAEITELEEIMEPGTEADTAGEEVI